MLDPNAAYQKMKECSKISTPKTFLLDDLYSGINNNSVESCPHVEVRTLLENQIVVLLQNIYHTYNLQ